MIIDAVRRAAQFNGQHVATICDGRIRTWAETQDRIARLAGALRTRGINPGDRVGILAANSDHYLEAMFATWWCGAVTVPMNARWSLEEHLYSIDDAGITGIIFDARFAEIAASCASARPTLDLVVAMEGSGPGESMEALIDTTAPLPAEYRTLEAPTGIFYTGGTTGWPKGATHSQASLGAAATILALDLPFPQPPRYLHAAPMFHLGDLSQAFAATLLGGSQVFMAQFDADRAIDLIVEHAVDCTILVPTMLLMTVDALEARPRRMPSMRSVVYGGSPISTALHRRACAAFPGATLTQGFGQTETCAVGVIRHHHMAEVEGLADAAGRPSYGVQLEIRDDEGRPVRNGQTGEICLRGPFVMLGYWNKPDETRIALHDGWVHTGDAGWLGDDGYLRVCDRLKDMIISGGENVYSAEVERVVATHPAVAQVAVIGVPDDYWGERVHAVVVAKPGHDVSFEDLYQHCKERIAGYKVPRSLEVRDALPRSPLGKVRKTELRVPHWGDQGRDIN